MKFLLALITCYLKIITLVTVKAVLRSFKVNSTLFSTFLQRFLSRTKAWKLQMAKDIFGQSLLNLTLSSVLQQSCSLVYEFGSADGSRDTGLLWTKSSDKICNIAVRQQFGGSKMVLIPNNINKNVLVASNNQKPLVLHLNLSVHSFLCKNKLHTRHRLNRSHKSIFCLLPF